MANKTVAFTVDPHLWELAKEKIPGGRSKFIQQQLKIAVGLEESEEAKITRKITSLQEEINVLQSRLCEIREQKRVKQEDVEDYSHVKEILMRFYNARGFIAENQIRQVSNAQDVDYDICYNLCISEGMEIRQLFEEPTPGNMKSGGSLR